MVKQSNLWFETCPTRRSVVSGIIKNVDILIIGGGVAGMTLLYHLVNSGFTNSFLVEESSAGYHASGRSSGQLVLRGRENFKDMQPDVAEEYLDFLCENNKRLTQGLKVAKFDCNLQKSGGLRLAVDDDEMETLVSEAAFINEHQNLGCQVLSSKEISHLIPSKAFKGGIYIPNEATFNPYKVVNGLMDLIERNGTRVLTGTQVESVTEQKDGSLAVSIRHKGVIRAKQVVYSTNAYSPSLLPELSDYMTPVRGQMVATDYLSDAVLSALPSMSMMCNHGSEYFRLFGGRLLVGGMRDAVRGKQKGLLYDAETSPSVYDHLRGFVADKLPFVTANFTHSWSGIMSYTKDKRPLVGPLPGRPNQYIMAGFNGYGFGHSLVSGMIIRDYLKKGSSNLPGTTIFDPARLS